MHVDNSLAVLPRTSIQRWVWGAFALLFVAIAVAAVALAPFPAQAGVKEAIAEFISWVLSAIVSVLGKLLLVAVYLLTLIAQYNDFVNAAAVVNGWVIVRDVGNMFFIIVLLIIAFATILNIPNYQWKALLPKLVIAAILINFSKTIAGLLIDFSQVITLTFVNGFAAAAGGNFAQMYKIRELVTLNPAGGGGVDLLAILGGYFLAFVMLAIALTTTLIMAVIFAFRIVMLWALVVLSPLPWLLNVLPQGKKYADKWWSMFGEYLTVGPVLAFFLWLALVSVGSGEVSGFTGTGGAGASTAELAEYESSTSAVATEAGKPSSLISFVISIAMLIAGLKITGEMGVIGAGAAKGALGKMEGMAKWGAKKFTGYRYASERVSGVMAARETARKDKVSDSVAAWQGRVGLVQQGIGTAMGGAGIAAGHFAFGRRAANKDKEADKHRKDAAAARDAGDITGAEGHEQQALKAQQDAASLRKKQRWTERGVNAGLVGGLAVASGGAGLVFAPALLGRGVADAGKKQREDAKQHKYKKMSAERDALKNLKPGDILAKAQGGPGVSNAEQMAAIITALEKQLVPPGEVKGLRGRLEGLKPDDKTMSTFDSIAGQKYAGTTLSKKEDQPERQRRLRAGQIPMKDIPDAELTADNGSFAADIALHASSDARKELTKTPASKAAYKAGVKAALDAERAKKPEERNVETTRALGAENARLGGSFSESFAADIEGFSKAIAGKQGGDIIAGISPTDLRREDVGALLGAHADPVQLGQALKKVQEEGDKERAEALRFAIDGIREGLTTTTKPVADSQAKVKTLQQSSGGAAKQVSQLEGKVGQAAAALRAVAGTPQAAEMQTRLAAAQASLDAERERQVQITKDLEVEQKNFEALKRQHAAEVKKLERLKGSKYNV